LVPRVLESCFAVSSTQTDQARDFIAKLTDGCRVTCPPP
jgi:hypothetical protein